MNEYFVWGGAGMLLAVVGTALIASEIQHGLAVGDPFVVVYGLAVVVATLITVITIAPSLRS